MADRVHVGRFTTPNDAEVVLFVVGLRANRLRAVREWVPVLRSIRPLLRELDADPSSGLLAHRTHLVGLREIVVVQYWSSTEALETFAHAPSHRQVWKDFYRRTTRSTDVGIWHETYVVPPGHYEAIYGSVPEALGLARSFGLTPVGRRRQSMRARLSTVERV